MSSTNVGGAVESSGKVASHLHPVGSFDVGDHPVPTGREEIWRFTPLKRLRQLHGDAAFEPSKTECSWTAPAGVTIEAVNGEQARALRGISGFVPNDRTSARVIAEVPSTLLVDVPAGIELSEPIVVTLNGTDSGITEAAHIALRFGAHSRAMVILVHEGASSMAQVVEVSVGDGANTSVLSIQDWAREAVHLSYQEALVGRDARYRHVAVSFGGDVVRMNANVRYAGPGGEAELLGLYFVDAGQHIEHRLFIDHNAPHTKSNAIYKGGLQGQGAHSVWVGDVLIRKVAEGIETFETNRNLVLTDGCRADSVPNLEIETGEIVGAGHASATGRFDDEQLFYLQSRGVTSDEARRLVVHGFFADIIKKIKVPDIEARLLAAVESELAQTVGSNPSSGVLT
ncbi:MAG: Fe-S cluster assembly protein SufD [Nocardioidaceae bacterium]|nr:Fe-S cluster assembly protein SufD [Nocardioidaceae bacterium]